jgi:hypothetical protein
MGRKIRFVVFDWSAKPVNVPNMPSTSNLPATQLELSGSQAQLTVTDPPSREHTANAPRALPVNPRRLSSETLPSSWKEIVDAIDTLLRHDGSQTIATPSTIPPPLPAGTSGGTSVARMSAAHLFAPSVSGPPSLRSPSPQTALVDRSASSPAVMKRL